MGKEIITKICNHCECEYKAPRYEIEYLMYLRLCSDCLKIHEKKERKKKISDMYDDDWSSSLNGSSAIGGSM